LNIIILSLFPTSVTLLSVVISSVVAPAETKRHEYKRKKEYKKEKERKKEEKERKVSNTNVNRVWHIHLNRQGILIKGEGSIQLTSLY
jgi:hypothetical protein